MNTKQLIEELNKLCEKDAMYFKGKKSDVKAGLDKLTKKHGKDAKVQDVIAKEKELKEDVSLAEDELVDEFDADVNASFEDEVSLVDKLDAKTKVARALEVLKKSIEDFKDATVGEVDLLGDSLVLSCVEDLDACVKSLEDSLTLGTASAEEVVEEDLVDEEPLNDEAEDAEAEDDEVEEETNFDDEASLDFLADEDNGNDEGDF